MACSFETVTSKSDLFHFPSQDIFKKYGVPVCKGVAVTNADEAEGAAKEIGGKDFVVKAQALTGGTCVRTV